MTSKQFTRILPPEDLPDTLWHRDSQELHIPPALADAYRRAVADHQLWELSTTRSSGDSPVGGLSKQDSDTHFAQAFSGSVARAELAVLDPKGEIVHVADAFARVLAGGRVALLDAPCGAGAASLAFLTTVAELRACGVLPRLPLEVTLVGGELSDHARAYADELLQQLHPLLQEQGIRVHHTLSPWDACCSMSTTALMQTFLQGLLPTTPRLVIVANFSGFLARESKQKAAEPQLGELFRYSGGLTSTAIWIEPTWNSAVGPGGLFSWVMRLVREKWPRFARLVWPNSAATPESIPSTSARFRHPLRVDDTAHVRLAVIRFELRGGHA
jgi:hypothetical protein